MSGGSVSRYAGLCGHIELYPHISLEIEWNGVVPRLYLSDPDWQVFAGCPVRGDTRTANQMLRQKSPIAARNDCRNRTHGYES